MDHTSASAHPQRIAQGVDCDIQFGGQSAPRTPDFLTPGFFWRLWSAGGHEQSLSR